MIISIMELLGKKVCLYGNLSRIGSNNEGIIKNTDLFTKN